MLLRAAAFESIRCWKGWLAAVTADCQPASCNRPCFLIIASFHIARPVCSLTAAPNGCVLLSARNSAMAPPGLCKFCVHIFSEQRGQRYAALMHMHAH